jgi:hypothetical protein
MNAHDSLTAYSKTELAGKGIELPLNIQSLAHDVKSIEQHEVRNQVEQTFELENDLERLATVKGLKRCVLGSNGMYLLFEDLRQNGAELQLLELRCQRGKNDFDIGVAPNTAVTDIWQFSQWISADGDNNTMGHGVLTGTQRMVDFLPRTELPNFPWRAIEHEGVTVYVQQPEEMIFEKIHALARGINNEPNPKWGIDIKLLKHYLMQSAEFENETQLEMYLSEKWTQYQEDQVEVNYRHFAQALDTGSSITTLLSQALKVESEGELHEQLSVQYGMSDDKTAELLQVKTSVQLIALLKEIITTLPSYESYQTASEKADTVFRIIMNEV